MRAKTAVGSRREANSIDARGNHRNTIARQSLARDKHIRDGFGIRGPDVCQAPRQAIHLNAPCGLARLDTALGSDDERHACQASSNTSQQIRVKEKRVEKSGALAPDRVVDGGERP